MVLAAVAVGGVFAARGLMKPAQPIKSEIEVEGSDYVFSPKEITVKQGAILRVEFKNTGAVAHSWAVPEFDITTPDIDPGGEASVELRPFKTGRFEVVCTVPGHKDLGMVGTLIVEK